VAKLKVGVIGCGYWGPKLARNFHSLPDTELAWVSDLRPERLAHMQELYPGVHATRNHRDLLESDVTAVVIAAPVGLHHAIAMEALRAGKHVLVEKPLAASVKEATEIAEISETLRLIAMVGHTFLYNPAVNAVRDVIASGELGQVYYINATRVNLGLLQPDINVIWDLAPHDVSILLHILGSDPHEVSAQGEMFVQKIRGIHEVAYMTLRFPTGILANLRLSWLDPVKIRQITVVGSKKMLVYDDLADNKVTLFDKGVEVTPYSDTIEEFQASYRHGDETIVPIEWQEPLKLECEAFVDSIRTGRPPVSSAWMGVKVVRVLEMAQRSLLNSGGWEGVRA
jgi:predicted dehydrogenase